MKLIEALELLRAREAQSTEVVAVFLACGFQPLHIQTFLAAEIAVRLPDRLPNVEVGLFGDLIGNLDRLAASKPEAGAIVIEWADLDARLDVRSLGGWGVSKLVDILNEANIAAQRVGELIERCSSLMPLSVSLPTLSLPPAFPTAGWQAGPHEAGLEATSAALAARLASLDGVRLIRQQRLLIESPPTERADFVAAVGSGFPYTRQHAAVLARLHALNLFPPRPLKGLITDLDDTVWKGILGEQGPEGVHWDLDHGAQMHGAYQLMLQSLMDAGAMVAVASHNDEKLVQQVFASGLLAFQADRTYPQEINWEPKSNAVARILSSWNVDASDVLFVDDSAHVIAEVKQVHPNINVRAFPAGDTEAAAKVLEELRDLFGKHRITEEDGLRLDSIRAAGKRDNLAQTMTDQEAFLSSTEPVITVSFETTPVDPRALELINKTNQFNLNGKRVTEGAWLRFLSSPRSFLLVVAYGDKFGPLGKVAVLAGTHESDELVVLNWVMSCRAFGRRIEHASIRLLFDSFQVNAVAFAYRATNHNGPMKTFLEELLGREELTSVRVTREQMLAACPLLYHQVEDASGS